LQNYRFFNKHVVTLKSSASVWFPAFLMSLALVNVPASAQDAAVTPSPNAISTTEGATTPAAAATVEGFRSARFGMDEAAVREAIVADFGVADADIQVGENAAERTRILSVSVPDVLDGGGTALVSYVLGYSSNKLDQVSVLWSPDTDASIDGAKLVANGSVLQSYFLQSGFDASAVVVDAAVPEGVVMFRGLDAQGRMALLLLRGGIDAAAQPAEGDAAGQTQFISNGLLLAYLANPSDPDVFSVEQGQF
jgi:hypothetical protein